MIGRLRGTVLEKQPPLILIDVGGVGYEVEVSMNTFCELPPVGEAVTLLTHHHVREDAHLLYGFATLGERQAFRALLRISGVGARTALAVLSGLSVAELAATVAAQEVSRLTRVPGVGKKTAERLLLELKDKLDAGAAAPGQRPQPARPADDVLQALLALGYSEREAAAAVRDLPEGLAVAEGIRQALRLLVKA
jgi:Holliday junction DNA helicase RuvA